jgi:hypothetical protein
VRVPFLYIGFLLWCSSFAEGSWAHVFADSLPADLPLPKTTVLRSPSEGYIFAAVPYWGNGANYLVAYDNSGKPVFHRKTRATCTDFKSQDNGVLTYFDYAAQKFFALDSALRIVDSFWVQKGFSTDEHDLKILPNGNVLLIGNGIRFVDMRQYVQGGDPNASVIVNVVQEIDRDKNLVFEWKSADHYRITDAGPGVNLLDPSFVHAHVNSVCVDLDGNLVISARNLDEITKIDRKTGNIIWRMGGKNNQFRFVDDSTGFSAQHSVSILPNGNVLLYDNGLYHQPKISRAVEYRVDTLKKTAERVWSYGNSPDISSEIWGNAQRLTNGNTFISWGKSQVAATEVTPGGEKVFEMTFPEGVYSYRIFRYAMKFASVVTTVKHASEQRIGLLSPNYPNPFNPTTTIQFNLPSRVRATLKIYDLQGRDVATLVDEERPAGSFSVAWNAKDLPSGIYFYRLTAGDFVETHSLVLLK